MSFTLQVSAEAERLAKLEELLLLVADHLKYVGGIEESDQAHPVARMRRLVQELGVVYVPVPV